MTEVVIIVALLAVAIAAFAIAEDLKLKGFKWNAKDGDKDGKVQEGTRWERKTRKKK